MTDVAVAPISVIARQLKTIRDDFIAELFDEMRAEVRGLNHDARMLERDASAPVMDPPAAAFAYARASAQRVRIAG